MAIGDTGIRVTPYAINAVGGAIVTLYGKILSRQIQIIEDFSGGSNPTGQGLIYYLPDSVNSTDPNNPAWLGPFEIAPQTEPITLGDPIAIHQPYGAAVANGPGVTLGVGPTPGTPYIQIKSAGTATNIRVTEFS